MTNTTHTAKHTPGPWVVRNMSDAMAEKFTVERLSDNGLRSVICRINDMEVCPEHGGTGSDANANLIAAAPAMYEALKHAAMSLHHPHCKAKGEYSAQPERYCSCHVQKAKAALAQAEGRDRTLD